MKSKAKKKVELEFKQNKVNCEKKKLKEIRTITGSRER